MKAKEMFKNLGYRKVKDNNYREIGYLQKNEYSNNSIGFMKDKTILMGVWSKTWSKTPANAQIDMQLLKAINKQCEELGWISDKKW